MSDCTCIYCPPYRRTRELTELALERDELRERVAELESALNRFDFEDVTLSEGDEMDICVTFEDQQILRAALAKTKEDK